VKLGEIDEITLDIMGTVVERLDAVQETTADEDGRKRTTTKPVAGPIAIAVDMARLRPTSPAIDSCPVNLRKFSTLQIALGFSSPCMRCC
jgi:hypothetical protein